MTDHGREMKEGHRAQHQWFKGNQIPDDILQALDTEIFTQDVQEDDELLTASSNSDSADSDSNDYSQTYPSRTSTSSYKMTWMYAD